MTKELHHTAEDLRRAEDKGLQQLLLLVIYSNFSARRYESEVRCVESALLSNTLKVKV